MRCLDVISHSSQHIFISVLSVSFFMTNTIDGSISISEHGWTWNSDKHLGLSDLAFLDKVNPSFALVFKRHLVGADVCEKFIRDDAKFLKCLAAVGKV